jgi:hypothetical protein
VLNVDLKPVELRISSLTQSLKALADDRELTELVAIIHKPGWTTPAEALLVNGLLDSMIAHTKHLAELKQALLAGARAVSGK